MPSRAAGAGEAATKPAIARVTTVLRLTATIISRAVQAMGDGSEARVEQDILNSLFYTRLLFSTAGTSKNEVANSLIG